MLIRALVLVTLASLAGCGTWKPDKVEAATAEHIDSRLSPGMALADFKEAFPDAVLIEGSDASGAWLASAHDVCFRCRTARGFQRSEDVFVRVVIFEDGKLARIEPAAAVSRDD